jgi:imidazole glycerol-phosphate synthase subunit HisH
MLERAAVAIVDYGLGNLFSVSQACAAVGLTTIVTADAEELRRSACIVLPGVGAFGDAMTALSRLGLVTVLQRAPEEGIQLVGICLGMQLLMEQSCEFGVFEGLGLIPGTVERLRPREEAAAAGPIKVPQVGWNAIFGDDWDASMLKGVPNGEPMYFVHSYAVLPTVQDDVLARSTYGGVSFCSAIARARITGFQFHPERSGPAGLGIYRNLAASLTKR